MVKKSNKRIMITLPMKQIQWLEQYSKERNLTISQLIKFILAKRTEELYQMLQIQQNPKYFQKLMEIINTPWLDNEDVTDDDPGSH